MLNVLVSELSVRQSSILCPNTSSLLPQAPFPVDLCPLPLNKILVLCHLGAYPQKKNLGVLALTILEQLPYKENHDLLQKNSFEEISKRGIVVVLNLS